MMTTHEWLVAKLAAAPGLAELDGRIFPDVAPADAANPCLVYQLIAGEDEEQVDAGPVAEGMHAFQLRIYAARRAAANGLREAARLALQNVEPAAAGGGLRIEGTAWGTLADTYERETREFGALAVVEIHFRRQAE